MTVTRIRPIMSVEAIAERNGIVTDFMWQAVDHEAAAEESERNEEMQDAIKHRFEASIWRQAADLVRDRSKYGKPQVTAKPEAPEIAF